MIKHLFFDAGNTLVFPNFTLVAEKQIGRASCRERV